MSRSKLLVWQDWRSEDIRRSRDDFLLGRENICRINASQHVRNIEMIACILAIVCFDIFVVYFQIFFDTYEFVFHEVMLDGCNVLGFIFAYTVAFGWVACVLGIVAAALACCVCCQCCKAKLDEPDVQQKPPVVVGQPA